MILVPHRPGLPDTRKQTGATRTPETQKEREINKINTFTESVIVWKTDRGLLLVQ